MRHRLPWLLGVGCLLLPVFDDPPLESGAYVQRVVGDRAAVAMITARPTDLWLRLLGEAGEDAERRWRSIARRRHVFELDGLTPDRRYAFSILDAAGREVDRGSFRSAPDRDDAPVRFAVIGDSGRLPLWRGLARTPLLHLPARWNWLPLRGDLVATARHLISSDPDFWLHVGDVVYEAGEHRDYESAFFRPFGELLRRAPVYPVAGNRDLAGDDGRQLMHNFVLPDNPVTGDERHYSFAYGPVRLIGMDLNDESGNVGVGPDHTALRFLREELAAVSEPWLIVFAHFPIYSASRPEDRTDLEQHLLPLLRHHQVDLYFAGHDHNYQRFGGDVVQVVTGGGGGALLEGFRQHPFLHEAEAEFHFCAVEVAGSRLRFTAVGNDSGTIDELQLDKGERPDRLAELLGVNSDRHARILALLR